MAIPHYAASHAVERAFHCTATILFLNSAMLIMMHNILISAGVGTVGSGRKSIILS